MREGLHFKMPIYLQHLHLEESQHETFRKSAFSYRQSHMNTCERNPRACSLASFRPNVCKQRDQSGTLNALWQLSRHPSTMQEKLTRNSQKEGRKKGRYRSSQQYNNWPRLEIKIWWKNHPGCSSLLKYVADWNYSMYGTEPTNTTAWRRKYAATFGIFWSIPKSGSMTSPMWLCHISQSLLQADASVGMFVHLRYKHLSAPSQNYNWITLLIGSNQAIFTLPIPSHSLLPYSPAPFGGKPFSPPPLSERGSQWVRPLAAPAKRDSRSNRRSRRFSLPKRVGCTCSNIEAGPPHGTIK